MQDALFTTASAEHNTPLDIIERMRYVFDGRIGIDPATNEDAQAYIRAERYHTAADDGLAADWRADTLWLNPPFSIPALAEDGSPIIGAGGKPKRHRVIARWVDRWRSAVASGEVGAAGLLVPARTDTEWFRPLFRHHICFVAGRLKFSDAESGAPFPTAIVYAGPYLTRFYSIFEEVGECGRFARS